MFIVRKNFPVFVTGASGFIGGQLARRLLADGRRVRVLSRRPLPELETLGAEVIPGDLHDRHALERGCRSAETVFHVAGRVGVWGPPEDFFRVNVEGTRNLLVACREAKVPRLVYTSSPSVVYNGGDLRHVNESAPLCTQAPCAYPTSKATAEREVLAAHGPELATIALRPHLVWGPGDKNVVPRILTLARAGKLKIIGPGRNRVDITPINNVVDAHLLAEGALLTGSRAPFGSAGAVATPPQAGNSSASRPPHHPGGRAYFITNGEPVVLWDWINEVLRGVGIPEIKSHVPLPVAYAAGAALETVWRLTGRAGEPPMTRFVAKEMATDHWFDISAARRDLGYHPLVSVTQATAELIEHYKAGNPF
ncbi:3 beta-hydroxysteroid dehydrogenase/Delta 5--_4-isomerase [Lacunisphaera limnophila]|uniref:3 beta-hydroxysteroid dehydrogenase/Delta 5-->4-isomerase n=1 Tax=Lacunisphaera limnophila TaxID=1838286 RepID=A0A1D8ASX9_9BACT|nr:NAD-dependent epimerase/dehydratase family protein [Lacunisphaera limnophila]AOS44009.1 3 beta-hydroxysteroid dehydrogenase/Delta 5-->4-isomerase [Lacunisphaera limnophila]